ncbi:NTF2 domain-containing protein (plasmid) [Rhizobium phaseoli]|uniref:nuclear transport factor 2 family protein n=1 Tax=Rhizobium phaseoli TaxID=396 RepID=UPI0007EA79FC|nr:nuclear transport factor 2 family protein [Rhizobium phaseoli]ANL51089.1 NTF2 domain-containing protein [Rhizobium phaseoli]
MAEQNATAATLARAYAEAIGNKDVDAIIKISADDIVCTSPIGKTTGVAAFRGFQEGFARMIKKLDIRAVYGNETQAVVVYAVETHPVPHSLVAELLQVKGGKIASTEVIYDATPYAAYMSTVQPH